MFGFIIGTLCLIGLFWTWRAARYGYGGPFSYHRYAHGYGHGFGYGRYGGGCSPRGGRRDRRRRAVRWLFDELDTTPGQEKAILRTLEVWQEHMVDQRGELSEARRELAQALGGDVLDQSALDAAWKRVNTVAERARAELSSALQEVHAALDGRQRKLLAETIADFRGSRFGYRHS